MPYKAHKVHIDAVLHLKCLEAVGLRYSGIECISLENYEAQEDIYLVGQVRVHSSLALVIHYGLRLRFCTCCGAHGEKRSNHLKKPCPGEAARAGKEALR